MSTTQAEFRARLQTLVNKFKANADKYLANDYAEAQSRHQFIDPLFAALGWDLEDIAGLGPSRCQVWTEKGDTPGKPDYTFRLNGRTQFFAEAKAPHVKLSAKEILQAKRYAWNHESVSIAVLTDFEELRVYDGSLRPDDKHSDLGLIFAYRYDQYLTEAALADLWKLSRDEVATGSLDTLCKQDAATRRARVPVDKAFLADLTNWRESLAKDAFKHDDTLGVPALNEAVQVLLDRLIFIRIAEDRRIVEADTLKRLVERWSEGKHRSLRAMLDALFVTINDDLNGQVFKPTATLDAAVFDDALTAKIIRALCDGPYDFAIIGVELLGSIYERYLGKTIRVTAKRAVVEDKPKVRKAGGVYYTPRYSVDYIVEQTVGKLIEGRTPAQIAKLRVLDSACGSGSFLLAAYQKLIDYHVDWYAAHPKEARQGELFPFLIVEPDGLTAGPAVQRLSIEKKGEILTNNIFGVDIDPQAIQVTMMSLYIKALEGETMLPHKQGLLPSLKNNIKCGNSLIGTDYAMADAGELERVRPFDWAVAFPQVFRDSKGAQGFDCVIGNPPYIKEYTDHQPFHDLRGTRLAKYYQGKMDLWYIFACFSIDLLKPGGLHSFIATSNWITNSGASILRQKILAETQFHEFVDFGDYHVFQSAGIQTMIYALEKTGKAHRGKVHYRRITNADISLDDVTSFLSSGKCGDFAVSFDAALTTGKDGQVFTFVDDSESQVLQRILTVGTYRLKSDDVATGIDVHQDFVSAKHLQTLRGDDSVKIGDGIFAISGKERQALRLTAKESETVKPYYTTNELERYYGNPRNELWVIYTGPEAVARIKEYPHLKAHLDKFARVITSDNKPYGLHRARDERFFLGEKIVSLRKTDRPHFTYTDFPCYVSQTFFVLKPTDINLKYLVGVLNSRVCHFWLDRKGKKQGEALQVDKAPLLEFPIRPINFSDPADVARHDRMVSLVERMLELHKRLAQAQTSTDRDLYQRQIESTDRQIDTLVYELYGLTKEEIAVIEST